ncbi:MAG: hypothetical protein FWG10_14360 [Eubacteriaceae bacterium]|nr:hypothetical protein [Eubacteriaceae bacterium]
MEKVIDEALDYDFSATLDKAAQLRGSFLMRLNPQVIMVRASTHPKRKEFSMNNPGGFALVNSKVMSRADEPAAQLNYWLYTNKYKNKIPSILKRSWAAKLSSLSHYELAKYKNSGLGIIDTVRVSHANSEGIDELMRTGTVALTGGSQTWQSLRSAGMEWAQILDVVDLPHMALMRNIRGIFEEIDDISLCYKLMDRLKKGVGHGRQFPFRYWSAMKAVEASSANHKPIILDALEECMDIASEQLPKLDGKTMCLSDNSGSTWGAFHSEYGSVTIAEIDNLSSVITARNSDEGYVGKFGDKLIVKAITKRNGILAQSKVVTSGGSNDVGASTENGIWLFFDGAITKKSTGTISSFIPTNRQGMGGVWDIRRAV